MMEQNRRKVSPRANDLNGCRKWISWAVNISAVCRFMCEKSLLGMGKSHADMMGA
jgi:trimethylamine:corrinoid methyltransferase-like protein